LKGARSAEAGRWVGAWGVLNILAVLGDQSWPDLAEVFAELWREFLSDEILCRFFLQGRRVDLYFEL
jgi:hypothetical protein